MIDHRSEVQQAALQWQNCYEAADLDCLMTLYTDDAFVALHGQPALRGKAAIQGYFAPSIGRVDATFRLDFETIEVHDDIAFLISKYWLSGSRDGEVVFRDAGRSLLIYRQDQRGNRLIHADFDQATPDGT